MKESDASRTFVTADLGHSVSVLKRESESIPADPNRDVELLRRSTAGEAHDEIAKAMGLTKYYVTMRLRALSLMNGTTASQ